MNVSKVWPSELVDLSSLIEHPQNFRDHDVGSVIQSIERWGVWRALVVQRSTNYVLVGNGELKALRAMGRTEGPVFFLDVNDSEALGVMLADNWIPSRGRNMPEELLAVMRDLREERDLFESAGLDDDDFEDLERDIAETEKPLNVKAPKPRKKTAECPECGHQWEMK